MILRCLGSSSAGNCYLLNYNNQTFILDCGIEIRKVKKALNYNISNITGAFSGHGHNDHSKSVRDFREIGIEVFTPYEQAIKKPQEKRFGDFKVTAIPMLDKNMEIWQHTNTDLTPCPIYGALIEVDKQKILYVTDAKQCVWNFKNQKINHILLGVNYQSDLLEDDVKRKHCLTGHMSLSTAINMIAANKTNALRTVILCHMGADTAIAEECVAEVQKVAGNANVSVAKAGESWELSLYPF